MAIAEKGVSVRPVVLASCVLLVLLAAFPCRGQFEGVVETKNLTRDETGQPREYLMTLWIKNDMVKVTNSAIGSTPGTTMIYRNDRRVAWILNDENETYYAIPHEMANEEPGTEQTKPDAVKYSLKRTRKARRILGYPAEQILITQKGQKTEIWGTKKLRNLSMALSNTLGDRESGPGGGWVREIAKMGFYPLRSSTIIRGRVAESQEVTKIERRVLPPELFEVPPTYKEQRADPMLRGLKERLQK
jgi:hypothetical protein